LGIFTKLPREQGQGLTALGLYVLRTYIWFWKDGSKAAFVFYISSLWIWDLFKAPC